MGYGATQPTAPEDVIDVVAEDATLPASALGRSIAGGKPETRPAEPPAPPAEGQRAAEAQRPTAPDGLAYNANGRLYDVKTGKLAKADNGQGDKPVAEPTREQQQQTEAETYLRAVEAARGTDAAAAERRNLVARGIMQDQGPPEGGEIAAAPRTGRTPAAPVPADPKTREQVIDARAVLRRARFSPQLIASIEGQGHDTLLQTAQQQQQLQRAHDIARRKLGDLRARMTELDPDFDPTRYEIEGDDTTTLNGQAETPAVDFRTAPAGVEDAGDRLDQLLERVDDPDLRKEIQGRMRENNARTHAERMELATIRAETHIEKLATDFPALTTPEGAKALAATMHRRDPDGAMLSRPGDLAEFMSDCAWITFGRDVRKDVVRQMVRDQRHHLNGQPERDAVSRTPGKQLTSDERDRIAYEAARAAGPNASVGDAQRVFREMLQAASSAPA